MVQAPDLRQLDDPTEFLPLHSSGLRRIPSQRQMAARAMVVVEVAAQYAAEMSLVENDHMVQAFLPNRSDQALNVRRLPR